MEQCPKCGKMTAQTNLYTGQLVCYHKLCGWHKELPLVEDPQIPVGTTYDEAIRELERRLRWLERGHIILAETVEAILGIAKDSPIDTFISNLKTFLQTGQEADK